jgi:hypothetical protein
MSQKQSMIKAKDKTKQKLNLKQKHTNTRNSNPPPSGVGFSHSGDEAPLATKQTANKEKGNNQTKLSQL